MSVARHPRPKELEGVPLDEIMKKYVGRFKDKKPDWAAFEDAKIEGYKRAQHRFIGAGGSGKHGDPTVIPAGNFTLSIMYVEPGQGNAAHTHEVEECFFVLQGLLDVFVEDESGGESRPGSGLGSAFPARRGSSTVIRMTRLNRSISRSCSAAANRIRWAMPMMSFTSAGTRT